MNHRNITDQQIEELVRECLRRLYANDEFLFRRNGNRGISERCLVFRFAYYLQNELEDYYVDCDFNSSFEKYKDQDGRTRYRDRRGKSIQNLDGTETKRFVDIIVHKRDFRNFNDFICCELKKWNNYDSDSIEKDINNLRNLTSVYGYRLGFYINLGQGENTTKWTIFKDGLPILENQLVF